MLVYQRVTIFKKSMWNIIFWVQKLKTLQDESVSFMFDVPICLAPCSPQRQSERQIKGFDPLFMGTFRVILVRWFSCRLVPHLFNCVHLNFQSNNRTFQTIPRRCC